MSVFISVVSHGHDMLIMSNHELVKLSMQSGVNVIIRDNVNSAQLHNFSLRSGFNYLASNRALGFGANNNEVFAYCRDQLGMEGRDYFCLFNPDLLVDSSLLLQLLEHCTESQVRLATINLYQDRSFALHDLNIKRFPSLLDFAKGFLLGSNPAAYDKSVISKSCVVDWASGAFMLFRVDLYEKLGGFDDRFFMYLEDVDICRRALELFGEPLWYFPQFKAVHYCQQDNKRLFSRHFWWFIKSMLHYFYKWHFRTRPLSR